MVQYLDSNGRSVSQEEFVILTNSSLTGEKRMEKKYAEIIINVAENGYNVNVCCKNFVFNSRKDMLKAINKYYKNPEKAKEKYCNKI